MKNENPFYVRCLRCLFILAFSMLMIPAYAQDPMVRLNSAEVSIEQAIEHIESQGIVVGVNHANFDVKRTIRLSSAEVSVSTLLDEIVKNTGHTYVKRGKHVVIVLASKPPVITNTKKPEEIPAIAAEAVTPAVKNVMPEKFLQPEPVEEKTEQAPPLVVSYTEVLPKTTNEVFSFSKYSPDEFRFKDAKQPVLAIKTNLLYGLAALTPNAAVELGTGRKTTLELGFGINRWNRDGSYSDNKKLVHTYVQPEFRWWTCERFNGHFFGVHGLYGNYNISGHDVPFLKFKKEYRYQGRVAGGGVSYGYSLMLSRLMGLEFNLGGGVMWLKYDRYDCGKCERDSKPFTKTRFGITKAGVSLVFLIK